MEKYWSSLKKLEKEKTFSGRILDSKTRDYLNMNYSSPLSLPLPNQLERPPSPAEAIERGSDFLTREYRKGFMPKFDADNYKKTLLRPALLAKANHKMIQKQTQNFDLEKLYETEKYQEFWMTSDTVLKIKQEISKLPFVSSLDVKVVIGRFLELVASIVRIMKHKKMLENEDKQNKKQLRATMVHFINETKLARKKAFKYAFQQEFIDLDKLDKSYKEEFINDIPKYSRQRKRNINDSEDIKNLDCSMDEKTIEQYSLLCENLPSAYKMTNYQMSDDQRSTTKKEFKKYINNLPQQLLNGINQIELQKAQSAPIFNTSNFISDKEKKFENNIDYESENVSNSILNCSETKINNDDNSDDFFNSLYIKHSPTVITIPFENKKNIDVDKTEPTQNSEPLTQQEIHFDYWSSFDPLENIRSGDSNFETLPQMHKISSTFEMNNENQQDIDDSLPFKLEYDEILAKNQKISAKESSRKRNKKEKKIKTFSSNGKSNGPTLIGDIWSTSDLLNRNGKNASDKVEEEEEEESNDIDFNEISPSNNEFFYRQLTPESEKRKNDAMEFLKSFKFSTTSNKSSFAVSKLQEIWENLGFSVQQKISLLVKYTSSIEESQRLNEALNFWELTFETVSRYNDSYRELKNFIKIEAPTSKNAKETCEMFKQQIENCEENVKQIAENLLMTFGDELIINRKTIQQIIPQRHEKMMEMIKEYCND